jgi:hypothetical protein
MSTYGDYVGAEGSDVYLRDKFAAEAVRIVSRHNPWPVYGYIRFPVQLKELPAVYGFRTLEEAHGWFTRLVHDPAQLYDYVAVFVATDLSRPVPGLENFGQTTVSGDAHVGNLWPFLLGLPLGALGGYFYRGWQEKHPGKWIPGIAGDYSIGAPWLDVVGNDPHVGASWLDLVGPYVGAPWLDLAGAELDSREQRRVRLQTRALVESAKREVTDAQAMTPAAAWVWSLDPPGPSPLPGRVTEFAVSQLVPFSSVEQAQAYMFERVHTPHVALALFDTAAVQHWPNPVRWTKSDDPSFEPLISQRVAQYAPGDRVGADPRTATIGSALGDVRSRAQTIANKRAGSVVGVVHTTKDNLWHALAFRNEDDADDWLETATQDQAAYTYAAYYDKDDASWPHPVIEKIGGFRTAKISGPLVGASLDDTRAYAKSLATAKPGNAVGAVRSVDNAWSTFAFPDLDAAIDWLTALTAYRASFTYAAAFEKGADGTAYFQQEEFGVHPVPPVHRAIPRAIAATSGEHTWRAA